METDEVEYDAQRPIAHATGDLELGTRVCAQHCSYRAFVSRNWQTAGDKHPEELRA